MIVAGIGSRRGVSGSEVVAAVDAALTVHGLERSALSKLATTEFKKDEAGIFEAGRMMGLEVVVVRVDSTPSPPRSARHLSPVPGERIGAKPAAVHPLPSRSGGEVVSEANRRGGMRHGVESPPLRLGPSDLDTSPPLYAGEEGSPSGNGREKSLSFKVAGVSSISEAAALAAAGEGARLAGPRIAVGRVTCAIAIGDGA